METKNIDITYTFKNFTSGNAFDNNLRLLSEGKLSESDFEVLEKDDAGNITAMKRKAHTVNAEVPVITIEGFTTAQNEHVQYLVAKQLEAKNKENIDNMTGEWATWQQVLEAPAIQRGGGGGFKVTAEMVKEATEFFREVYVSMGVKDKAIELITDMSLKRFSAASCTKVQAPVLEKVKETILAAFETIKSEDAEAGDVVQPVVDLWVGNIDKVLNPEEEVTLDMF